MNGLIREGGQGVRNGEACSYDGLGNFFRFLGGPAEELSSAASSSPPLDSDCAMSWATGRARSSACCISSLSCPGRGLLLDEYGVRGAFHRREELFMIPAVSARGPRDVSCCC